MQLPPEPPAGAGGVSPTPDAPPPVARPPGDGEDVAALRRATLAGLRDLIYAQDQPAAPAPFSPEHDPALRRRTEAVEMVGRFPDAEAVTILAGLVEKGEAEIPYPVGRWLRDTALLVLLRSTRLPQKEVAAVLLRHYSILRTPWPWEWNAVYDDLPLLARYGKLGVFFRAFWLWPLLIGAIPTLAWIWQLLFPHPLTRADLPFSILITLGVGLEIYLLHQVLIALLAGWRGPPLRLPGGMSDRVKGWLGLGLTVLVAVLLGTIVVLIASGSFASFRNGISLGALGLLAAVLLLPLFLLPMFMVAHDLEGAARYLPKNQNRRLRVWAVVLRRLTDFTYILVLPGLAGARWGFDETFGPAAALYLVYLFVVPFLVAGGLGVITRLGASRGAVAAPPPPSGG
jgi:hypothetical protein